MTFDEMRSLYRAAGRLRYAALAAGKKNGEDIDANAALDRAWSDMLNAIDRVDGSTPWADEIGSVE